jgi:large subunit ribosomal protein L3
MKSILGKKLGMTQVFSGDDLLVPITVIEAGPCKVLQSKEKEKDGYEALQIGYDVIKKEKNVSKAMMGHFKKAAASAYRFVKEVKMEGMETGGEITVDIFSKGDKVCITGTSKGKGFQGVMKRHNYKGGPESHGSMFKREPGSIGSSAYPSRVWKNKGMPGHMGSERVTIQNLEIFDIKKDQNLLLVKGAVPGANGAYLIITAESTTGKKD